MATNKLSIIIILIAALATWGSANDHVVGDDKGWHFGFDSQTWANGKEFYVGDKLIFKYPPQKHDVVEVEEKDYEGCCVPPGVKPMNSGCDEIVLETPGRKRFICGIGKHCAEGGMKLMINVLPHLIPATPSAPAGPSSKEHVVGEDKGWTLDVDYQEWANGKQFVVGDKLVFKYSMGKHNVFKVNETCFQQCIIPPPSEGLTSGNDKISLSNPGYEWYICGVNEHCQKGMKFSINVQKEPNASPAAFQGARKLMPIDI